MSDVKVESGLQLVSRLSDCPPLERLHPLLFPDGGPRPQTAVEVLGPAGAGKTLLLTDLLALCLLPRDCGGRSSRALLINTEHGFDMLQLAVAMEVRLKRRQVRSKQRKTIVQAGLSRLLVIDCYDSCQLYMTFQGLEAVLCQQKGISLVAVDSLTTFYWADRPLSGLLHMDMYARWLLRSLQLASKNSKAVILYTKPDWFVSAKKSISGPVECTAVPTLESINYRIFMGANESSDLAVVSCHASTTRLKYSLGAIIEWAAEDVGMN